MPPVLAKEKPAKAEATKLPDPLTKESIRELVAAHARRFAGREAALAELARKSLMIASDGGQRYRMLETIRDYAAERLADDGERDPASARHCEHFFEKTSV